VLEAAIRVK